jgi:hypothetical protein
MRKFVLFDDIPKGMSHIPVYMVRTYVPPEADGPTTYIFSICECIYDDFDLDIPDDGDLIFRAKLPDGYEKAFKSIYWKGPQELAEILQVVYQFEEKGGTIFLAAEKDARIIRTHYLNHGRYQVW